MEENLPDNTQIQLAAEIVAAYVSNNPVPPADLPGLIEAVYGKLESIALGAEQEVVEAPTPAVSIKKSITPDFIICLEDGKKFKSLKRHLRTKYDMSTEEYRAKWGLPSDYPMVAPNYAAARSQLAKAMGLGAQRSKGNNGAEPARRGRPRKSA